MIDAPGVVRGGSRGFTVLVLGELVALAAGGISAGLGGLLLAVSAAAGAVSAGVVAGRTQPAPANGAAAGLLAWLLTVPLRLIGGRGLAASEVVFSMVVGAVLGSFGGRMVAQAQRRGPVGP
jgi:hypothetical protein